MAENTFAGMFTPTKNRPSTYRAPTGPLTVDVTGIAKGAKELEGAARYDPKAYKPFQFAAPGAQDVGPYGTTSPEMMQDVYGRAMGTATAPVRAQGRERMRMASQGFGGAGFMGSPGQRAMALQSAQRTGEDVRDIGRTVGATMAGAEMGELREARGKEFEEAQRIRDMQFRADVEVQTTQAAENFRAAGFSDQQSKTLADDAMRRATSFMQYGFMVPQMQAYLGRQQQQGYQDVLSRISTLGGLG